ncbi:hypothetical protein [Streptomyces hypolithicus]
MSTASQYPAIVPLAICILVSALLAFGLAGYGFSTLDGDRRPPGVAGVARGAAALSAAAGAAMYAWGSVHLFLDETGTAEACQSAATPAQFGSVDRYSVSYVPPSLQCHLTGGGSYDAAVPGYVAPVMTGLAIVAVTLAVIAAMESAHHTRDQKHKEKKL